MRLGPRVAPGEVDQHQPPARPQHAPALLEERAPALRAEVEAGLEAEHGVEARAGAELDARRRAVGRRVTSATSKRIPGSEPKRASASAMFSGRRSSPSTSAAALRDPRRGAAAPARRVEHALAGRRREQVERQGREPALERARARTSSPGARRAGSSPGSRARPSRRPRARGTRRSSRRRRRRFLGRRSCGAPVYARGIAVVGGVDVRPSGSAIHASRMRSFRTAILIAAGALAAISAGAQRADAAQAVTLPDRKEVEDALPEGGSMTGREIFDRFLENRLHSAVQYQTVISRDPGGNEQTSRFWVRWKDYRDKDKKAVDGVYAKTLVKFDAPDDMRATGFLMVGERGPLERPVRLEPVDRPRAPRGPARSRRHGHRLHLRRHRLEEHRGRRLPAPARRGDRRRRRCTWSR